jgi:arabinofuranosyltransferase
MTAPFILCLLIPFAIFAEDWLRQRDPNGSNGAPLPWFFRWPSANGVSTSVATLTAFIVVATTIATFVAETPFLFDDSFISYRYAKNLAFGHGLAWNPGETPSEGYTNLLLVILVAPVIRFGGDPLLATRVLSALSGLGISVVLFGIARRELGASRPVALILAAGIASCSFTAELSMVGLETVIFAAALFLSYDLSQRYFETERDGWMLASGGVAFLAFLLRPEVVFLPMGIAVSTVALDWQNRARWKRVGRLLALSFALPLGLYLGWKLMYFGSIVPNPALVKIPGKGLVRPRGVASVRDFLAAHSKVVIAAGIGALLSRGRARAALTSSLVLAVYLLFYLRVDTLMEVASRFLYPALPFLFVIALPAYIALFERLLTWRQAPVIRSIAGVLLFLLVFYANPGAALHRVTAGDSDDPVKGREIYQASVVLERVGLDLATLPGITDVTIGSTDAGLLPYFSGARHVDMAGLVTRFLASHKDVQECADYFFAQKPDLIIVRTRINGDLIAYEHGVLGDYPKWAHHAGWNAYTYEGGLMNGPRHNLHFFVRRDGMHVQALRRFVHDKIAEPDVTPPSVVLGTAT